MLPDISTAATNRVFCPAEEVRTGSIAPRMDIVAPLKVAIVDDSVVVRGLFARWLRETPGLQVVGTFRSGREIIERVSEVAPDIIILDIEMPDIDGLAALPHILRLRPGAIVIVASTLTARNADISFKCMSMGARDYLLKPQTNREVSTSNEFRQLLIEKIFTLGLKGRRTPQLRGPIMPNPETVSAPGPLNGIQPRTLKDGVQVPAMRAFSRITPKLLLIGASTGGPQAVMMLLKNIKDNLTQFPVLIAQHMPAAFTIMFAEHLTRHTQLDVVQATDGETLKAGRVYVAPGGRHMALIQRLGLSEIRITDDAPVNFCKPSVDVLFESSAEIYGAACLAIMLTGMGVDGARGAYRVAQSGGSVIAQDEASSVVWGMPGATVRAGACAAIMSVPQMSPVVSRLLTGRAP